jgi:chemotaxis protein CheX
MDAGFVNAHLVAVQNVFKTMLSIEITLGKPCLKTTKLTLADVTGVIGFAGDKKGTFSLAFTKESALFMYKSMVGEEAPSINAEVIDAIGEITNIISGQTRVEIEKLGYKLSAALPTGESRQTKKRLRKTRDLIPLVASLSSSRSTGYGSEPAI